MPGSAEKLAKLYSTNLDQDGSEPPDDLKPDEDYYHDYLVLASVLKLMFEAELLPKKISDIKPCELSQLSPLLSLAVGSKVNKQATELYDRMMELASFKGLKLYSANVSVLKVWLIGQFIIASYNNYDACKYMYVALLQ